MPVLVFLLLLLVAGLPAKSQAQAPPPHPTVYVIDWKGMVRWKFTEVNYKIRPTNAMILAALESIP